MLSAPCGAQTLSPAALDDVEGRFELSLGTYLKSFSSIVRVGLGGVEIGTDVDLEDDLGLDVDDVNFRLDGHYRFTSRSRLDFGYYLWRRSASAELEEEIHWDDTVFEVGLDVRSNFDADVLKVTYGYSVLSRPRSDLALTVGISAFDFDMGITAGGSISGDPGGASGELQESTSLLAPAPVLGISFSQLLGESVLLRLRGEFFKVGLSDWDAGLVDLGVYVDWFPWENVGLGLAYNWIDLSYDKHGTKEISVDYEYRGPVASVMVRF